MSLTPEQYADQLRGNLQKILSENRPLKLGAYSTVAKIVKRAFTDGVNEQGQSFSYSDKEVWISAEANPGAAFSPEGKTGRTVHGNGEPYKTKYFENYLAFKKSIGRNKNTNNVNWTLSGDLRSDYSNAPLNAPAERSSAVQISVNEYVSRLTRPINQDKYDGLSSRNGLFLTASPSEIQEFYRVVELELRLLLEP